MHFYSLSDTVTAFSTTRESGALFPTDAQLFLPHHQVHGTVTRIIDHDFISSNALRQTLLLDGVDALCTNIKHVCVCVKTADCIPILLFDETNNVVSAVHAGWKGTLKRIVQHNIRLLYETYGTQPQNLKAVIGPGIGPDSFEVGDEVYQAFKEAGFDMDILASRHPALRSTDADAEKWHINLWECNRRQMTDCGVLPCNIQVAGIDTYVEHKRFFSARQHGNGRIINGIMLK